MSWVNVGAAAVSAGAGLYASNKASDSQAKGGKQAIAEQQRQYNTSLQMLEPNRFLGYQAADDLARLYGYGSAGYQPANMLLAGGGSGANVKGVTNSTSLGGGLASDLGGGPLGLGAITGDNALGFLGGPEIKQYGGRIDPITGRVDVQGAGQKKDDLYTNYLRTGEWTGGKGGRGKKLRSAIDALREQGYQYGEGGGTMPGSIAPRPAGEPGDMSRFFTSPGYQFRRDEGQRDIGNSFAARGGAASGNALRALTEFNQGLASQEFGNYQNALFNMAGMGQTATNQAIGVGQNTANNVSGLQQGIGDSRASGVMGGANSVMGAVNAGLDGYLWNKYLNSRGSPPTNSLYGPYAGGYRFPG